VGTGDAGAESGGGGDRSDIAEITRIAEDDIAGDNGGVEDATGDVWAQRDSDERP
jgi:hypothetical protein